MDNYVNLLVSLLTQTVLPAFTAAGSLQFTVSIPWPLVPFAAMYLLWVLYLAAMALIFAYKSGNMKKPAKVMGSPLLLIAYLWDILFNIVIGTLMFMKLPEFDKREWPSTLIDRVRVVGAWIGDLTLSARLSLYYEPGSTHWRSRLAWWFAVNLINDYDLTKPKGHIR